MQPGRAFVQRRAFLSTLAAGIAAVGARVALLPRSLSDDEIARLADAPASSAPTARTAGAEVSDVNLGGSMERLNPLAQNLELAPHVTKFRPAFKINTVEREPQKQLASRDAWSVGVGGLVDRPFSLSPSVLADLPNVVRVADFHCVEGWGVKNVRWEGVRLATLLERAGLQSEAQFVTFETLGGVYTDSLTLEQALDPDTLLATRMNGEPLRDPQGYPVRLVVSFMYGYKSVKWVSHVRADAKREIGFWERRGWQLDPYV